MFTTGFYRGIILPYNYAQKKLIEDKVVLDFTPGLKAKISVTNHTATTTTPSLHNIIESF